MKKHQIRINVSKCSGCGQCARICVAHNIKLKNKKAEMVSEDCIVCGQ